MTTPTKLPDPPYSARERATSYRVKCYGSGTVSPGAITTGSQATGTITVLGAALGDFVDSSYSATLAGCTLDAYVSDGDTVTWVIQNVSGGTLTPAASSTLRVIVFFINQGQSDGL